MHDRRGGFRQGGAGCRHCALWRRLRLIFALCIWSQGSRERDCIAGFSRTLRGQVYYRAARATDKIELHKGLQACLSKKKIHSGFEQSSTMLQICYNSPMWHIRTPTPLGFCGQLHQEASNTFPASSKVFQTTWGRFHRQPRPGNKVLKL